MRHCLSRKVMGTRVRQRLRRIALGGIVIATITTGATAHDVLSVAREIEDSLAARVGLFVHDYETGNTLSYNADERFPLNSTFKLLACGALLAQVDAEETELEKAVAFSVDEIVVYSPVIQSTVEDGRADVTLDEACRAVLSVSDNTAANLVLAEIGGPLGLTRFLRGIGDEVTRLDRWEPDLNEARPADPRDTTTPRAIMRTMDALVRGDVLSEPSRQRLREWLADHQVADALFRSALPPSWSIDDRTGAGGYGSRSIIAILYPPDRRPIAASVYITETEAAFDARNAAIAQVGRALVRMVEDD